MFGASAMNKKAIALLSGGLDSTLAVCLIKEQGIEIEAVNFQTMFGCCKDDARQAAYQLGVKFNLIRVTEDYLKVIEKPKYGYGRGVNACVDCRIYMFLLAKKVMENAGASFIISGEVLDQRPMSQKMKDFQRIEADAELEGLILRPLSAKRLPLTLPEKEGIVDREKLLGVHGRSRKKLLELAAHYGIENPPMPSAGCALTSPAFAKKVRDIFEHRENYKSWEFEILKMGRHFRLDAQTKIVISRNQEQNELLENLHPEGTLLMTARNFGGPDVLFMGPHEKQNLEKAGAMMLRYSQQPLPPFCEIEIEGAEDCEPLVLSAAASEEMVGSYRIV